MRLRTGVALAIAFAVLGEAPGARPAGFDYVYIEANEGGSSGGHAAIRFDERIYHFQNRGGLLVLDRESTRDFFHAYALLNNRTVHLSRVSLAEADRALLLEQFNRRHHAQERQLDVLDALREDRRLLETWRDGAPVRVPALGFFALGRSGSPVAREVLRTVRARYGDDFAARRRAEIEGRLARAAAVGASDWRLELPTSLYDEPPFAVSFARRYLALAADLAALEVLERATPLADGATIEPEGRVWELSPAERERGARASLALREALVRLAGAPRDDWGEDFLIGLARLEALDRSLARGRFVLLDTLPSDARRLDARHLESRLDIVAEMLRAGHGQVREARRRWTFAESPGERDWTRLEEAANRVHELEGAVREQRDLRLARGTLVPNRPGPGGSLALPTPPHDELEARLESVREREVRYADALDALYRYGLIRRNCVSELFHTIDHAFGGDPGTAVAALGGRIDGHRGGTFVPFVSAWAVDREYRVVARRTLPSYRERRLAEMNRGEGALLVSLRESNTLTARSYRRGYGDSFFLFFTDGAWPLRPLLGALNLIAGIGESVWGLVRLPFDGGDTLVSGLEGALVSVPELAFWNIRKGTNDWVSPSEGVDVDR